MGSEFDFGPRIAVRRANGVMDLTGPLDPASRELFDTTFAKSVMEYLQKHPQAMDTVDGIAEWWIAGEESRIDLRMLGRVLEELTRQGFLERIEVAESTHYRLNKT
jgi:hypothetical protein